jgi:acetolactate synthase-1/2/3 large subunit
VDLEHPDLVALAAAYDIPARRSSVDQLAGDLEWALSTSGPALVVLEAALAMPSPSAS